MEGCSPAVVIADKAYDSDPLVKSVETKGAEAVIPPKVNRKQPRDLTNTWTRYETWWSGSSIESSNIAEWQLGINLAATSWPSSKWPPSWSSFSSQRSLPRYCPHGLTSSCVGSPKTTLSPTTPKHRARDSAQSVGFRPSRVDWPAVVQQYPSRGVQRRRRSMWSSSRAAG